MRVYKISYYLCIMFTEFILWEDCSHLCINWVFIAVYTLKCSRTLTYPNILGNHYLKLMLHARSDTHYGKKVIFVCNISHKHPWLCHMGFQCILLLQLASGNSAASFLIQCAFWSNSKRVQWDSTIPHMQQQSLPCFCSHYITYHKGWDWSKDQYVAVSIIVL